MAQDIKERRKAQAGREGIRRLRNKLQGFCPCGKTVEDKNFKTCEHCRSATNARDFRKREVNRVSRIKLRKEALSAYGAKCSCCGEKEFDFLAIDHIDNRGHLHRDSGGRRVTAGALCRFLKSKGYPSGFQILCVNCNWSKRLNGYCTHKDCAVLNDLLN